MGASVMLEVFLLLALLLLCELGKVPHPASLAPEECVGRDGPRSSALDASL
jgi:hypothetical protein